MCSKGSLVHSGGAYAFLCEDADNMGEEKTMKIIMQYFQTD